MKSIKILAVDDESAVLTTIKALFPSLEIDTESNSIQAAERMKREKFDIFLIDYQMPNLNGIELLEEIKEVYENDKYIGILSTAYGTIHLFKEEYDNNLFAYYVEKPFNIESFKTVINNAIIELLKIREKEESPVRIHSKQDYKKTYSHNL